MLNKNYRSQADNGIYIPNLRKKKGFAMPESNNKSQPQIDPVVSTLQSLTAEETQLGDELVQQAIANVQLRYGRGCRVPKKADIEREVAEELVRLVKLAQSVTQHVSEPVVLVQEPSDSSEEQPSPELQLEWPTIPEIEEVQPRAQERVAPQREQVRIPKRTVIAEPVDDQFWPSKTWFRGDNPSVAAV